MTRAGRQARMAVRSRPRTTRANFDRNTVESRGREAATTRRGTCPGRRSGRESRRPRVPASDRGAVLELARAPTNVLDQIGARNYFPAQPAEVREVVAHDDIPGKRAGIQNAGEARREEADRAEDGQVAHPARHERPG